MSRAARPLEAAEERAQGSTSNGMPLRCSSGARRTARSISIASDNATCSVLAAMRRARGPQSSRSRPDTVGTVDAHQLPGFPWTLRRCLEELGDYAPAG